MKMIKLNIECKKGEHSEVLAELDLEQETEFRQGFINFDLVIGFYPNEDRSRTCIEFGNDAILVSESLYEIEELLRLHF